MSVEVTDERHLRKICEFLEEDKRPDKPPIVWCKATLKELKRRNPDLHIFIAEDENKKVRAVLGVRVRGVTNPKEPKIWTDPWLVYSYEDFENLNVTYATQVIDYAIKYGAEKYGLEKFEFPYTETMPSRLILDLFKDYWVVREGSRRPETGIVLCLLDIKKYLGE